MSIKLTESKLRSIVKQELRKVLNESFNRDIHDQAMEYYGQEKTIVSAEEFAKDLYLPLEKVKQDLFDMITDDMGDSRLWLTLVGDPQSPEEVTEIEIGDPQGI